VTNSISNPSNASSSHATTTTNDHATALLSIKTEIILLKTIIATAMEQIKTAIASLTVPSRPSTSSAMDTEVEQATEIHHSNPNPPDLSALITDLKNEIATIVQETRALLKPQLHSTQNINSQSSSVT